MRNTMRKSNYPRLVTKAIRKTKRFLNSTPHSDFNPYIVDMNLSYISGRFFIATPQASVWYDPINPHAKLEYEWVLENVPLQGKKIVDGGAHHGQYSVVFALGANRDCELISVDPSLSNLAITEINLKLNGCEAELKRFAITENEGSVNFSNNSNGMVINSGGVRVTSERLTKIGKDADVVKLDIEGSEFGVVPDSIDEMSNVQTWIVEVHPYSGNSPNSLIDCFRSTGYDLLWVNRQSNTIEKYKDSANWDIHSTIFAVK